VLLCLLERPGELVTREELQQRLWGDDTIVDFDHSLGTALNKLREALRDSADNPHFIETLARRGYRFIAPVMVNADAPAESFQSIAGAASLPGVATNLMPPPTSAEIPRASAPGRKSRWHALAWTLAATAVVIVAFLLGLSAAPCLHASAPHHADHVFRPGFAGRSAL
jgi:DNA-binding winged helix-turn-helix (wHTH) protein